MMIIIITLPIWAILGQSIYLEHVHSSFDTMFPEDCAGLDSTAFSAVVSANIDLFIN